MIDSLKIGWATGNEQTQVTGIGEIIFLDAHLPAGNHVGDDVLLRRILVNSVRIFGHGNYFPTFLIHGSISRLQCINHLQSHVTDRNGWRRVLPYRRKCNPGGRLFDTGGRLGI